MDGVWIRIPDYLVEIIKEKYAGTSRKRFSVPNYYSDLFKFAANQSEKGLLKLDKGLFRHYSNPDHLISIDLIYQALNYEGRQPNGVFCVRERNLLDLICYYAFGKNWHDILADYNIDEQALMFANEKKINTHPKLFNPQHIHVIPTPNQENPRESTETHEQKVSQPSASGETDENITGSIVNENSNEKANELDGKENSDISINERHVSASIPADETKSSENNYSDKGDSSNPLETEIAEQINKSRTETDNPKNENTQENQNKGNASPINKSRATKTSPSNYLKVAVVLSVVVLLALLTIYILTQTGEMPAFWGQPDNPDTTKYDIVKQDTTKIKPPKVDTVAPPPKKPLNSYITAPKGSGDVPVFLFSIIDTILKEGNAFNFLFDKVTYDTLNDSFALKSKEIRICFAFVPDCADVKIKMFWGYDSSGRVSTFRKNEYKNSQSDSVVSFVTKTINSLLAGDLSGTSSIIGRVCGYYDDAFKEKVIYNGDLGYIEAESFYEKPPKQLCIWSLDKNMVGLDHAAVAFLRAYHMKKALLEGIGNFEIMNKKSIDIYTITTSQKDIAESRVEMHLLFKDALMIKE